MPKFRLKFFFLRHIVEKYGIIKMPKLTLFNGALLILIGRGLLIILVLMIKLSYLTQLYLTFLEILFLMKLSNVTQKIHLG